MRSTSKKVKISVVSSSGEVQMAKTSLSQIQIACITHENERASQRAQDSKILYYNDIHYFQLISTSADLTHHSCELLAKASLETGTCDTQDFDSDFLFQHNPGLISQNHDHALDEDVVMMNQLIK